MVKQQLEHKTLDFITRKGKSFIRFLPFFNTSTSLCLYNNLLNNRCGRTCQQLLSRFLIHAYEQGEIRNSSPRTPTHKLDGVLRLTEAHLRLLRVPLHRLLLLNNDFIGDVHVIEIHYCNYCNKVISIRCLVTSSAHALSSASPCCEFLSFSSVYLESRFGHLLASNTAKVSDPTIKHLFLSCGYNQWHTLIEKKLMRACIFQSERKRKD